MIPRTVFFFCSLVEARALDMPLMQEPAASVPEYALGLVSVGVECRDTYSRRAESNVHNTQSTDTGKRVHVGLATSSGPIRDVRSLGVKVVGKIPTRSSVLHLCEAESQEAMRGQRRRERPRTFNAAESAFAASAIADILSSKGLTERNHILGTGNFGARQAATSLAISASVVILAEWVGRRHPRMRRAMAVTLFVASGVRFGAAARNWHQ